MDDNILGACALCLYSMANYVNVLKKKRLLKKRGRPRQRRFWMTSIHLNRTRNIMENSFKEMISEDSVEFSNLCRMSAIDFEFLLNKIEPFIKKRDTQMRVAIPTKLRLAITLRYLATGESYRSLHYIFKVSHQVISLIVPEVCKAINSVLEDQIGLPQTPEEWIAIEEGFRKHFPRCVGVIDGKHILVQRPDSEYEKFTSSIVLMSLIDSDYRFIFAEIGGQDSDIFRSSLMWQKIDTGHLNLPPDSPLPTREQTVPYVFIGNGAFPLSKHIMKPFPGNHDIGTKERTFNKKLSSSRVMVENVYGVLTSVFQILRKTIDLDREKVSLVIMTCILLHNFLRNSEHSRKTYTPPGTFDSDELDGSWRRDETSTNGIRPMRHIPSRALRDITEIRNEFADYFHSLK